MTTAKIDRSVRYTHWELGKDHSRNLPKGRLTFTLAIGGTRKPSVLAAYLGFPDSDGPTQETKSFDDDRIALDYRPDGRLRGIEFQSRKALAELPEFSVAADGFTEADLPSRFLQIAFETVMLLWDMHNLAFEISGGPETAPCPQDDADESTIVAKPQGWIPTFAAPAL